MLRFILKIDALIFIDTPELQRKGWQKKVCKLQSLSRFQAQMIANTHPGLLIRSQSSVRAAYSPKHPYLFR